MKAEKRVIKFRGKRIKDGKWVYGYLSAKSQITTTLSSEYGNANHLVDSDTVGQFIELEDENGTEVYEGDYVKCRVAFEPEPYYQLSVEFIDGAWCFVSDELDEVNTISMVEIFEVSGNIYD